MREQRLHLQIFSKVYTIIPFQRQSKLYQMITDNISTTPKGQANQPKNHRILRIVKEAKNCLVISNGVEELMFKKYLIKDEKISKHLQKRFHLKHQSLIQLKSIEYGREQNEISPNNEDLYCGILFEKYTKTMEQSIKENISFTHEEVIQTFMPIKNVLDFMIHQNYDPGELKYASIVCTQDYQIKFIDSILHEPSLIIDDRESYSTKAYSDLAELMFNLLFPKESQIKSWSRRYQIAKQFLNSSHFHFFQEVYKKFGSEVAKSTKSKKIKKQSSKNCGKKGSCKSDLDSPKKNLHQSLNCQSGKQNLIIQ